MNRHQSECFPERALLQLRGHYRGPEEAHSRPDWDEARQDRFKEVVSSLSGFYPRAKQ